MLFDGVDEVADWSKLHLGIGGARALGLDHLNDGLVLAVVEEDVSRWSSPQILHLASWIGGPSSACCASPA